MAEDTPQKAVITLVSSNGEEIEISRDAITHSITINDMLKLLGKTDETKPVEPIPTPNVTSKILKKIVEYCEHYKEYAVMTEEQMAASRNIPEWDLQFLNVEQQELYDLIIAANYLDIPNLVHYSCQFVANMIEGKSVEEIRQIYDITNDFTPEEEEELRREHVWCDLDTVSATFSTL